MNYADMILDSVGVANLDEVNLSYMIVSVVIFQKFTWLVRIWGLLGQEVGDMDQA